MRTLCAVLLASVSATACLDVVQPTDVALPIPAESKTADPEALQVIDAIHAYFAPAAGHGRTIGVLDDGRTGDAATAVLSSRSGTAVLVRVERRASGWQVTRVDSVALATSSTTFTKNFAWFNGTAGYHFSFHAYQAADDHLKYADFIPVQAGFYVQRFDGTGAVPPYKTFRMWYGDFRDYVHWAPAGNNHDILYSIAFDSWHYGTRVDTQSCYVTTTSRASTFGLPDCQLYADELDMRYRITQISEACPITVTLSGPSSPITAEGRYTFTAVVTMDPPVTSQCGPASSWYSWSMWKNGNTNVSCGNGESCSVFLWDSDTDLYINLYASKNYGAENMLKTASTSARITISIPKPPPLTISTISGPTYVNPHDFNTWSVNASGGYPRYRFDWYLNGSWLASGSSVSPTLAPESYNELYAVVTDSRGNTSTSSVHVVFANTGTCATGDPDCAEFSRVSPTSTPSRRPLRRPPR